MLTLHIPIPPELRAHIPEGENLRWWGRPKQGLLFTSMDWFAIPFSVLWLTMAFQAVRNNHSPIVLAFFLFGFAMLVGRFPLDTALRSHTLYALTDRRAIILRKGLWPACNIVLLNGVAEVALVSKSATGGTIRFGSANLWAQNAILAPALERTPQFLAIADADEVFSFLQNRNVSPR